MLSSPIPSHAEGDEDVCLSMVDSFLVEALQNPRHRLTILRMELGVQGFLLKSEEQHFEFQQFPTSYLRLAAHRVAQHYGLQTTVLDNGLDGSGNVIMAWKTPETKYPSVCLSGIPTKMSEHDDHKQKRIVIRPRPNKGMMDEAEDTSGLHNPVRTVEQRKEDYDRARARIFNSLDGSSMDEGLQIDDDDDDDDDGDDPIQAISSSSEKGVRWREAVVVPPYRMAILKDREKDRTDPDYDRSYDKYVRSIPNGWPFVPQSIQFRVPRMSSSSSSSTSSSSRSSSRTAAGAPPFYPIAASHMAGDQACPPWPCPTMVYAAHSYDQFHSALLSTPSFCQQQPLSFEYSQNK